MKYSPDMHDDVREAIAKTIPQYIFDQYRHYPAADSDGWRHFLQNRVDDLLTNEEALVFIEISEGFIYLVGCKVPRWDEEHFGFGMAKVDLLLYPADRYPNAIMGRLLDESIAFLRNANVRFVSSHISGEDLLGLHLLEDRGFRYYQTTVYSVTQYNASVDSTDTSVRLWREEDLPAIVDIARRNQFVGGHFYSDTRFDRKRVDMMYEKWIRTSWSNRDPIAVIEENDKIAGYFAFVFDDAWSRVAATKYARMTSLAMDSSVRKKGLGMRLFGSVIAMAGQCGAQYISSEYPLKNYPSGRVHTKHRFHAVHEKVLSHLWL